MNIIIIYILKTGKCEQLPTINYTIRRDKDFHQIEGIRNVTSTKFEMVILCLVFFFASTTADTANEGTSHIFFECRRAADLSKRQRHSDQPTRCHDE